MCEFLCISIHDVTLYNDLIKLLSETAATGCLKITELFNMVMLECASNNHMVMLSC
jgi:hypothetical protein